MTFARSFFLVVRTTHKLASMFGSRTRLWGQLEFTNHITIIQQLIGGSLAKQLHHILSFPRQALYPRSLSATLSATLTTARTTRRADAWRRVERRRLEPQSA